MPLFEFDDGSLQQRIAKFGAMRTMTLTDVVGVDAVSFTFSVTAVGAGVITHRPGQGDGEFTLTNALSTRMSGSPTSVTTMFSGSGTFVLQPAETGQDFSGPQSLMASVQSGTWIVRFEGTTDGQDVARSLSVGANTITAPDNTYTAITFIESSTNGELKFLSLTSNITCYLAGTAIATVDGVKSVEDVVPGDRLRRADGGETVVRWLGRQSVSKTFADPRRVNPICIRAGTLGNARDLYVSPDHGIALEGYLINASALVNGETITQVAEMPGDFTYYHVETERHELILAEGIPTESYLDMPSRAVFDNGHERANAPMIEAMDMPRISSRRMLPNLPACLPAGPSRAKPAA